MAESHQAPGLDATIHAGTVQQLPGLVHSKAQH